MIAMNDHRHVSTGAPDELIAKQFESGGYLFVYFVLPTVVAI
jgi:hypothetical protein